MNAEYKDRIVQVIRDEVAKYVRGSFDDSDDFVVDLRLLSDDLSAIALTLEEKLGVRIDRSRYREVNNIEQYARLWESALQSQSRTKR